MRGLPLCGGLAVGKGGKHTSPRPCCPTGCDTGKATSLELGVRRMPFTSGTVHRYNRKQAVLQCTQVTERRAVWKSYRPLS